VAIFTVLTGALERNTPRTYRPEKATEAITGDNQEEDVTYVADLAINPEIDQVDFYNNSPIFPKSEDSPQLRKGMQQPLNMR
jgi:hypothetical protein